MLWSEWMYVYKSCYYYCKLWEIKYYKAIVSIIILATQLHQATAYIVANFYNNSIANIIILLFITLETYKQKPWKPFKN